MGFNLLWNDKDIENASEDFSYHVARELKNALKDKERQIKWSKNMTQLRKRFHDMFNLDCLTVAEIRFSSMSAEYRALCIVITDQQVVVFHSLVPKKGSAQKRQLKLIEENSERIEKSIRKNIL
ncbi:MAG: type II toxin-antitoxin system RelE/ParE family toxin [Candidatus Nanohaloarchaea archaeon]